MEYTPEALEILNKLRDHVSANAKAKGFKDPPSGIPFAVWFSRPLEIYRAAVYMINLVGEAAEFWEAARKGKLREPCDKAQGMIDKGLPPLTCAEEELADMIIRCLDNAAEFEVDIAKAIAVKAAYNAGRAYQHGGKLA
jgi:NTP pyrophosphatase (non-canonical NTP hydrolase)